MGCRECAAQVVLLGMLVAMIGCASVDTAGPMVDEWPEAVAPWERLERGGTPAVEGWEEGRRARGASTPSTGIFDFGYQFYVRGLTQIDGPRCEHRPTCSRYSFQAVSRHGVVLGSFLAVDRLMRGSQSSALRRLPIYRVYEGRIYFYDPVEANDFFL
jgi:hypothetical protein